MEKTLTHKDLNNAIIQMYNREISPCELADIYFKYKLYSCAATYYVLQLNELRESNNNDKESKSYCFAKIAECYYNQQKNHNFSGWQLSMIHDMCQESISYNPFTNLKPYLILGKCLMKRRENKRAYFVYNDMVLNLDKFDYLNSEDKKLFIEAINEYLTLAELHQIIKYDEIYVKIVEFMTKNKCFKFEDFSFIYNRFANHIKYVKQEEIDIMKGNIQKYYNY